MSLPVEIFKSLSDLTRLRIVILLTHGRLCVCDLVEVLSLPQSTISRHMAKLKASKLVKDYRKGRWIHYSLEKTGDIINDELFKLLKKTASQKPFAEDLKKLTNYLKEKSEKENEC